MTSPLSESKMTRLAERIPNSQATYIASKYLGLTSLQIENATTQKITTRFDVHKMGLEIWMNKNKDSVKNTAALLREMLMNARVDANIWLCIKPEEDLKGQLDKIARKFDDSDWSLFCGGYMKIPAAEIANKLEARGDTAADFRLGIIKCWNAKPEASVQEFDRIIRSTIQDGIFSAEEIDHIQKILYEKDPEPESKLQQQTHPTDEFPIEECTTKVEDKLKPDPVQVNKQDVMVTTPERPTAEPSSLRRTGSSATNASTTGDATETASTDEPHQFFSLTSTENHGDQVVSESDVHVSVECDESSATPSDQAMDVVDAKESLEQDDQEHTSPAPPSLPKDPITAQLMEVSSSVGSKKSYSYQLNYKSVKSRSVSSKVMSGGCLQLPMSGFPDQSKQPVQVVAEAAQNEQSECKNACIDKGTIEHYALFSGKNNFKEAMRMFERANVDLSEVRIAVLTSGLLDTRDVQQRGWQSVVQEQKSFLNTSSPRSSSSHSRCRNMVDILVRYAPFIKLLLYQVTDRFNQPNRPAVMSALKHIEKSAHHIDVVILAFSEETSWSKLHNKQLMTLACDAVLLAPAGNDGEPYSDLQRGWYPAESNNVIAVGAHTEHRVPCTFSSNNHNVDFLCPGANIPLCCSSSAQLATNQAASSHKQQQQQDVSGTTYACAHAAVCAAWCLRFAELRDKQQPDASRDSDQTRRALLTCTENMQKLLIQMCKTNTVGRTSYRYMDIWDSLRSDAGHLRAHLDQIVDICG